VRKKILHFDRERAPERVVHALGHGAYGTFQSYGDWSNLTSTCWLRNSATSEVFTRLSVVIASNGGNESGRDTHGFATKIYSSCGNHDLVGNHLSSFFINDGADFPDLVHAVKFEQNKGFPTGGSAHTTACDFFTQHPEGAFQLMNALSDLGIPRDIRHVSGNRVHAFRFINDRGQSQLFKWYWIPMPGHRSLVYDEATKIAGKNNNFQRVDLYHNIKAGIYPEREFAVRLFPDDGAFMWNGIDLIQSTQIVPFEWNPPIELGKLTLNKNPTNFFAEPESIAFAPSNVVKGVSFVPDPLLQWRLMSYDDTATHGHNSPNGYLLPINTATAPINNNLPRWIHAAAAVRRSFGINTQWHRRCTRGQLGPDHPYKASAGQMAGMGNIDRYVAGYDWPSQACTFWGTLDIYAKQHTVDAYRFELGHVSDAQRYPEIH
jgi:catalase